MSLPRKLLTLALMLALAGPGFVRGQEEAAEGTAKIDAKAQQTIEAMFNRLRDAKSLQVAVASEVLRGGEAVLPPSKYDIRLRQPNLIAVTLQDKADAAKPADSEAGAMNPFALDGAIVSDGKKMYVTAPMLHRYTAVDAPATFAEMREALQANQGIAAVGLGGALTLPFVMGPESMDQFLENVESLTVEGTEEIDNGKFQKFVLTSPQVNVHLFLSEGKAPELRRTEFIFGAGGDGETLVRVDLTDWKFDKPLDDKAFAFTAPADSKLVKKLIPMPGEGPNPLLGKEAPAIKLPLLDGGDFDLAAHKDKNVVVLDFWATWCGPCVQAMPVIDKVAEELAGEGVVLYAVNLQEDAEAVKSFLAEKMLQVNVALDSKGELAQKFGVQAIPQTVLIGRDGTVQVVHVGFSGNLEEELRSELKALLENKNLAEEELKEAEEE